MASDKRVIIIISFDIYYVIIFCYIAIPNNHKLVSSTFYFSHLKKKSSSGH